MLAATSSYVLCRRASASKTGFTNGGEKLTYECHYKVSALGSSDAASGCEVRPCKAVVACSS